jgi:cytochrome c oxidase assembly protein subunit 15
MYKKFAYITIGAVYFLILVGGIVRATGSGMGCPDWPMCFGMWIPPTSIEQLPVNYQEIFGTKLKGEVEFNVFKTWVEYVNRLVGVLIGFLIFLTLFFSYREYWKRKRKVVLYSLVSFILVGVEGYLGSKVVSTELNPALITIHMLLAIAVVLCLIYTLFLSNYNETKQRLRANESLKYVVLILMLLSLGQLVLGTQIREMIDVLSSNQIPRNEWLYQIKGGKFYSHIVVGVIVLLSHIMFYRVATKESNLNLLKLLVFSVIIEFVIGVILGIFDVSALGQPIHLTLATIIIGLQFSLYLKYGKPNLQIE